MAYTTLFALVPFAALSFALFSAFGVDEQQFGPTLNKLLEQILPPNENELLANLKLQVFEYLQTFGQTVQSLGAVSMGVLIFTGLALLNTIESALNRVWRVSSRLGIVSKITNFWAVITLGPLLFFVSIYWYSQIGSLAPDSNWNTTLQHVMDIFVPIASIWVALTLMYYKMPATTITLRDASLGALFAAILFEAVKRGFAYFITLSTTYSQFYGVLTSIPLFLFWLFLVWVVILFGAEISYQAGSIKVLRRLRKYSSDLGEIGAFLGLRILMVIGDKFVAGEPPPTEQEITIETGSDQVLVRACLQLLTNADMITAANPENHTRSLVKSPAQLDMQDVFSAFLAKWYTENEIEEGQQLRELEFLNAINSLAKSNSSAKDPRNWTLEDLITASQSKG